MQARLDALIPKIAEICHVSGTPAVSLGVQDREGVYVHNYGLRDVQAKLLPTSNTNYCIASMSKAFASAALGILVEEGKLKWDTPVRNVLPGFEHKDKVIQDMLTVNDLLSHRTGLQRADTLWLGAIFTFSTPMHESCIEMGGRFEKIKADTRHQQGRRTSAYSTRNKPLPYLKTFCQ